MSPDTQVAKITSIDSLAELDAYERSAKSRGILAEENVAICERRRALTPQKKRRRK